MPEFHVLGVPLFLMFVGVLANRLGRADGDDTPKINDLAVGTLVLLTALGVVAGSLTQTQSSQDVLTATGWLVLILFVLFASIDNDRYRSWHKDANGKVTKRKHWFWGIILPDLLSFVILIMYQLSKV